MAENPLAHYRELDPDCVKNVEQMSAFALTDGALPKKVKLLVALALDATHGAVQGVKSLALQAIAVGATRAEIAETIRVACYVNGVSCVYTAAAAFRELDF
ncbi:MAG: 4-carboxymuconolactone decarboxylase [Promethearchaeota archaeon CR_4]|nr:MAG: 4-carboxymuconolactone decarboxylase [Candidatus Lokiarchaeota archaeon CR_4]